MALKLSVIIPTMWRSTKTPALLNEWGRVADEILVIDNAPAQRPAGLDGTKLKWLPQAENIGVNPAWNLGVAEALGETVVLCNDDLLFDAVRWWSVIEANIEAGFVIGLHPAGFNRTAEALKEDAGRITAGHHLGLGWGCLLAMHRADFAPIPKALKIWFGDDWLAAKLVPQSMILPCDFEASETVQAEEFAPVLQDDAHQAQILNLLRPAAKTFFDFEPSPLGMDGSHHRTGNALEEPALREAFNQAFHTNRPEAEWAWRYHRPGTPGLNQICFDAEGRIVAHVGWYADRIQIQGLELLAAQAGDLFRLGEPTPQNVTLTAALVFDFTRHLAEVPDIAWSWGFRVPRLRRRADRKQKAEVNEALPWWTIPSKSPRWWRRPPELLQVSEHREALDRLWRRAAKRYFLSAIRDRQRFASRYDAHPIRSYVHIGVLDKRGELSAWATLGERLGTTMIVDLLWDGKAQKDLKQLFEDARIQAAQHGHEQLTAWLIGDAKALEVMASMGWTSEEDPQEMGISMKLSHPAVHASDFPEKYYMTGGDSDLV